MRGEWCIEGVAVVVVEWIIGNIKSRMSNGVPTLALAIAIKKLEGSEVEETAPSRRQ